eukprot:1001839-Alexandrium_andersonii.AAC.1
MSASLVGSEMCIRDSPRQVAKAQCEPFLPLLGASAEGERAGNQNAGNPVSYTHLTLPTICSV